jgi:hypothetical protein
MFIAITAPAETAQDRRRWGTVRSAVTPAAVLALLCAVLLSPLLIAEVPPLMDYPNHLARMYVLAFGQDDPVLASMYASTWSVIPNLAIDLITPPLLHVLPLHVAGRLLLALVLLLPIVGTFCYSRAVARGTPMRRSWWPVASVLVAYNGTFLMGFLNFLLGVGLALLFAAAWIRWRGAHRIATVALGAAAAAALFFCHLMGLAFFLVLVGSSEAEWLVGRFRRGDRRLRPVALRIAGLLPMLLTAALLYATSALEATGGDVAQLPLAKKLLQAFVSFVNYDVALDSVTAIAVMGFIVACLATGRLLVAGKSIAAIAVLVALYVVSPFAAKGTCFLDTRFAIMLGFLLFGALAPVRLPRIVQGAAAVAVLALFLVRIATIATIWHAHNHDVADLRRVIADVEPGSRVLVATVSPEEAPQYWNNGPRARRLSNGERTDMHLAALLLLDRRAFWPFLFAMRSQQPVTLLSPFRELAERTLNMPEHRKLRTAWPMTEADLRLTPVLADWNGVYDYVLLLEAGAEPDLAGFAGDRLELLGHADIAALFRVRPHDTEAFARTLTLPDLLHLTAPWPDLGTELR